MQVFEKIFEAVPDGLLVVDTAGVILFANGALGRLFGYAPAELLGLPVERLTPRNVAAAHVAFRDQYQAAPKTRAMGASNNLLGCRKDGSLFPVDVMLSPLAIGDDRHTLCVVRNATARKETEEKLHIANTVFQSTQEGIVVTDVNCRIVAVNPAFEMATEYSKSEVLGQHMRMLRSGQHDDFFYRRMWDSIVSTGEWQGPIWNRRKSGEIYHEWLSISTVRDDNGQPIQYVGITTDMGRMNHVETAVERLAHYDALTGLPNRLLGRDRLQQALEVAKRQRNGLAVFCLDLDQFKHVNDSYGHAVGDALLKTVALRLDQCLRAEDTICRLSGDEFMLVLPEVRSFQQISHLCTRILSELGAPFDLEGMQLFVSFSIGVALHPQDGSDAEALMLNANTALYEAKKAGHTLYRVFEPSMNVKLLHYVETCDALRQALEQQQFELHYQPQIDLHSGQVAGVEALIRWRRPGHGLIAPGAFIGIAEESGLIVPIGRWVLHEACRQAAQWQRAGWRPGRMAVNLSAIQFRQGVVEQDVRSALEVSGLDPAALELELTESTLLQHDEPLMAILAQWSARGIRLSIDDFGTGSRAWPTSSACRSTGSRSIAASSRVCCMRTRTRSSCAR